MRNEISNIEFPDKMVEVTPVLDTNAYADEDILFQSTKVAGATRAAGVSFCNSIVINDKDDQGLGFDIYFFRSDVTLAAKNAAENMSDAVRDEILAVVSVSAGDYVNLANGQVALKGPSDKGMMVTLQPTNQEKDLWIGAVAQGTPTYTASGLVIKFGFIRS